MAIQSEQQPGSAGGGSPGEDWAEQYLGELEAFGLGVAHDSLYLWPRTPLTPDHQEVIARRVGASDLDLDDPRSRSAMIIGELARLKTGREIDEREPFRVLDVACGDAVVLWAVKRALPEVACYGIDCNRGLFATHAVVEEAGVRLYSGWLQHLVARALVTGRKFDVVCMLNTYRGWESADLRASETDLPDRVDAWLAGNSRHAIVTATAAQIERLTREGWEVVILGKGEEKSQMCRLTPPAPSRARTRGRRWWRW